MKSKLYIKEIVENKDRKFGSILQYYPAKVELDDGSIENALFTEDQINVALERASENPEDIPEDSLWQKIFGKEV